MGVCLGLRVMLLTATKESDPNFQVIENGLYEITILLRAVTTEYGNISDSFDGVYLLTNCIVTGHYPAGLTNVQYLKYAPDWPQITLSLANTGQAANSPGFLDHGDDYASYGIPTFTFTPNGLKATFSYSSVIAFSQNAQFAIQIVNSNSYWTISVDGNAIFRRIAHAQDVNVYPLESNVYNGDGSVLAGPIPQN